MLKGLKKRSNDKIVRLSRRRGGFPVASGEAAATRGLLGFVRCLN
jgi:hypothetical protein